MSLPEENPILIEMLHSRGFSVNWTGNSFSRIGVNMALRQIINAEAKSRLKAIMAYVDVASAVKRWVIINSMGNQSINSFLELVRLKRTNDCNQELRQSQTEKDK